MPFHEGGDTLRADGVRADVHQTLPAEVLQRAALYPEHAVSDTTEVLRDMVTGTVIIRPHQQFGGGRQHTLHAHALGGGRLLQEHVLVVAHVGMYEVAFRAAEHLFGGKLHRKVVQRHTGTATEGAHQADGKTLAVAPTAGDDGTLQAAGNGRIHLEEQHRLLLTAEEERHVRNTIHAEEDAPGGRGDPATIRHADVGLHQVVHHYRHVGKMIVGNLPAEQFMKQNGQLHNVVVILLSHGSLA